MRCDASSFPFLNPRRVPLRPFALMIYASGGAVASIELNRIFSEKPQSTQVLEVLCHIEGRLCIQ